MAKNRAGGEDREITADPSATGRERAVERSLRAARVRAEERSERYIQTALSILAETGRTDFTVQELVERSGTSLRGFYAYFESKDELMLALVEEVISGAVEQWRRATVELSSVDALHYVVRMVYGRIVNAKSVQLNKALTMFNIYLAQHRPDDRGRVLLPISELIADIIGDGVATGAFRDDVPADALAAMFMQTLVGASEFASLRQHLNTVPADRFFDFLHAGLLRPADALARTAAS